MITMTRTASNRRRFRYPLGFATLSLGACVLIAFLISARWWFGYGSQTWLADIGDGTLYVKSIDQNNRFRSGSVIGFTGGENHSYSGKVSRTWTWTWWTWGPRDSTRYEGSAYTIWPLAPLLIITGASLYFPGLRAVRRIRRNQCPKCAYSRAGLTATTPCPECSHI